MNPRRSLVTEMPQDPFPNLPESLAVMKALHELHTAAVTVGFSVDIATEIITRLLVIIMEKASAEE